MTRILAVCSLVVAFVGVGAGGDSAPSKRKQLATVAAEYLRLNSQSSESPERTRRLRHLNARLESLVGDALSEEEKKDPFAALEKVLEEHQPESLDAFRRSHRIRNCFLGMRAVGGELYKVVVAADGKYPEDLLGVSETIVRHGLEGIPLAYVGAGLAWDDKDSPLPYADVSRAPVACALPYEDTVIVLFQDFHVDQFTVREGKIVPRRPQMYGDCQQINVILETKRFIYSTDRIEATHPPEPAAAQGLNGESSLPAR